MSFTHAIQVIRIFLLQRPASCSTFPTYCIPCEKALLACHTAPCFCPIFRGRQLGGGGGSERSANRSSDKETGEFLHHLPASSTLMNISIFFLFLISLSFHSIHNLENLSQSFHIFVGLCLLLDFNSPYNI